MKQNTIARAILYVVFRMALLPFFPISSATHKHLRKRHLGPGFTINLIFKDSLTLKTTYFHSL